MRRWRFRLNADGRNLIRLELENVIVLRVYSHLHQVHGLRLSIATLRLLASPKCWKQHGSCVWVTMAVAQLPNACAAATLSSLSDSSMALSFAHTFTLVRSAHSTDNLVLRLIEGVGI